MTRKLKRFEIASLNECDILVPISQRDLSNFRSLGARIPSVVIPIGLSPEAYPPDYSSYQKEPSISFIGSLDWLPNQQGLSWFLERVWLPFQESCPNVKLHIAGRNMPKWLFRSRIKNIVVHGEVPDAVRFINAHSIMVVPLLSGSGMRAKILEGMALGKVVVTTTLGLEGIAARDREEVLIADDPASFLQLLEQSCRDHRRMEFLGRQARDFVTGQYESKKMARRLLDIYASMTVEAM